MILHLNAKIDWALSEVPKIRTLRVDAHGGYSPLSYDVTVLISDYTFIQGKQDCQFGQVNISSEKTVI